MNWLDSNMNRFLSLYLYSDLNELKSIDGIFEIFCQINI